jgi:hypothetical protein
VLCWRLCPSINPLINFPCRWKVSFYFPDRVFTQPRPKTDIDERNRRALRYVILLAGKVSPFSNFVVQSDSQCHASATLAKIQVNKRVGCFGLLVDMYVNRE